MTSEGDAGNGDADASDGGTLAFLCVLDAYPYVTREELDGSGATHPRARGRRIPVKTLRSRSKNFRSSSIFRQMVATTKCGTVDAACIYRFWEGTRRC